MRNVFLRLSPAGNRDSDPIQNCLWILHHPQLLERGIFLFNGTKESRMEKQRYKISSIVLFGMLICSVSVATRAQDETALFKKQFGQAIAMGRTGDTAKLRTDAAERLADLTSGIDGNRVDKKALADLVWLFDRPEELVRLWVAVALG
jgi:hypothetical protein